MREIMWPESYPLTQLYAGGATALVAHHGAHVLSHVPEGGDDLLWLSRLARFDDGQAIRGGIPICWPWFAKHFDPGMPSHGVARTAPWELETAETDRACFFLKSNPETREQWPHEFELRLALHLTPSQLDLTLTATNTGDSTMICQSAFHPYFAVSDIEKVTIEGLADCEYLDKTDAGARKRQEDDITFSGELDRIYIDTTSDVRIRDHARVIRVAKRASQTTVVWNPWIEKAERMADFGDEEYRNMLCVEPANAGPEVIEVAPGVSHSLGMTVSEERSG